MLVTIEELNPEAGPKAAYGARLRSAREARGWKQEGHLVTTDTQTLVWSKSSYSGNGGSCVEWAPAQATTGTVPVRDSKDPNGPVPSVPTRSFAEFVAGVKGDAFSAT
ncbi:DUF397 domain-containing protein [Streptomyces sp. NPDC018045]|uniref:DUF397 domain-containing protein n=1 Tax=Streptomyces sp. NPDC018045 TaxID=3365037 RepID=UPI0037B787AA